jgi:poly(3-hydroxybutyrate) depolymerase
MAEPLDRASVCPLLINFTLPTGRTRTRRQPRRALAVCSGMLKLSLLALALAACHADDSIDNVPYPSCSANAEQCLDSFAVDGHAMPLYRNVSLTAPNAAITRAVIVVHGSSRDASNFFYSAMTAAEQDGVDATTAVIAPHFECGDDNPPAGQLAWQCSGDDWSHGYGDTSWNVSSYAVIDAVVQQLANKALFPNLTRVVVTGMGSGGQLAQRYAATNQLDPLGGIALSYAVVSPSTYVWLDSTRPASTAGCSGYDDYYYGLQNRTGYVAIPSAEQIVDELVARDVAYLVGSEDTLANEGESGLDTSCGANAQGPDRLSRAQAFFSTVQSRGAAHTLTIVPGCMSSRDCMYYAPEVRAVVLGEPKI